jgi:menaquinol-cytochrome c reductase iron-sulfur subunit
MNKMAREHEEQPMHPHAPRRQMTRRQFLSYTLGAAGAFMAGGVIIPMIRFAIDPLLKPKAVVPFVKVAELSQISSQPVSYSFQTLQIDGWIEKNVEQTAWIAKSSAGELFALSPVCKHLGCTIDWNSNPQHPNEFFCPCHAARYTSEGKNLAIAPAPLDEYEVKIENGFVYLGGIRPNTIAT